MRSRLRLAQFVVAVLLLGASWGVMEWRCRTVVSQAIAEHDRSELAYWKKQLVPVYKATRTVHVADPTTKDEVFGPLVRLVQEVPSGEPKN